MKDIDLKNSLLVVSDKYGTYYFRSSTIQELHDSCMSILMDRLAEGWYCNDENFIDSLERVTNSNEIKVFRGLPHSYLLLESRSRYEYEKVELEWFQNT